MKFGGELFWGLLLIVIGGSLLAKHLLKLNISVFSMVLGFIFIYVGLSIMFGGNGIWNRQNVVFEERNINQGTSNREYNIIFGNGSVDMTNAELNGGANKVEVNTIFAKGTIFIDPRMPVRIKANSAFGNLEFPDGSNITFGDSEYRTESFSGSPNYLEIDANCVFGKLNIVNGK